MIFDVSRVNLYNLWPVFADAFSTPTQAPHAVPGLLDSVRQERNTLHNLGVAPPPVTLYFGMAGTGL
jgi:hypothetical protein